MQNFELVATNAVSLGRLIVEGRKELGEEEFKHQIVAFPYGYRTVCRLERIYHTYKDKEQEMGNYSMSVLYTLTEKVITPSVVEKVHELAKSGQKITRQLVDKIKREIVNSVPVEVVAAAQMLSGSIPLPEVKPVEVKPVVVMISTVKPVELAKPIEVKPIETNPVEVIKPIEIIINPVEISAEEMKEIAAAPTKRVVVQIIPEMEAPRKVREGAFFVGMQVRFEDKYVHFNQEFKKMISQNPLLLAGYGTITGFQKIDNVTAAKIKWNIPRLNDTVKTLPVKFVCPL